MKKLSNSALGGVQATAAFLLWGVLPVYWAWLHDVRPVELLLHRIVWCALALGIFFGFRGQFLSALKHAMRDRKTLILMLSSTVLISGNWLLYIWAVHSGFVLETSLGYFINPILSIFLGALVLRERLNLVQWLAVALIGMAITAGVVQSGYLPWIALTLASSFAIYGLIKKIAGVPSVEALYFESFVAGIPSLIFLLVFAVQGQSSFINDGIGTQLLLLGAGIVTAAPLIFFGWSAKHLRLSTIGIMQFIAPTLQFLLALTYFGEPLNPVKLKMFIIVWAAIALYLLGSQAWLRAYIPFVWRKRVS